MYAAPYVLKRANGRCIECHLKFISSLGESKSRKRPFEALYNHFVGSVKRRTNRGKKRDVSNSLSYEDFLDFTRISQCHYCEDLIEWVPFGTGRTANSNLDRKDNTQGYSKENCVVCCWPCNELKGSRLSYEEMLLLKDHLIQIRQQRRAKLANSQQTS